MFDAKSLKQDFPILNQLVNEEPLIYLDSAATSQKPKTVIDAINHYYSNDNANVHRGVHTLAERSTSAFEKSRDKVKSFINAKSRREIIFTRGTTTSLNWLAQVAKSDLKKGDEVIISIMEHHSNIIPWQEVCHETGAVLKYVYLKDNQFDMDTFKNLLSVKTKWISIAHISNVLGIINPISEITALAHEIGAKVVVDAAQSAPHISIDAQELDCDFMAFSGHKMLGPTGIGILYGKEKWLNQMFPIEFGGEMIDFVYEQEANWKELPWKLEAGTPNIEGAIALGYAIDYLDSLSMTAIQQHEQDLVDYLLPKLVAIEGLTVYGPHDPKSHTGVISFNLEGVHPHDFATALDYQGIAVRAGHHCAQPLLRYLGLSSTVRASFYLYNTKEDCDSLIEAILATKEYFNGSTF